MRRRWIGFLVAAGLLAAAPACDRPSGTGGSESLVAPSADLTFSSYSTTDGYTLLSGSSAKETSRSATLTVNGGKLSIGAHQLVIPYGAVTQPTTFTFTMVEQPYMAAKLTAVQVSDGSLVTKFAVPLPLKISYAKSLTPIPDPAKLRIYYIVNGSVASVMPTTVDIKGQTLYTELNHFSEYSPGLDP